MTNLLLTFFSTGVLGGLARGMTRSELIAVLGDTTDTFQSSSDIEYLRYGPLQVRLDGDQVTQILLNCIAGTETRLPSVFLETELPPPSLELYTILEELDAHQISWSVDQAWSFDRQVCIATVGGVRLYFDLDRRGLQTIQAF